MGRFLVAVALLAGTGFGGVACRDRGTAVPDASSDGGRTDVPSPLTLAIAVTGCAVYDATASSCSGRPPLTLSFAPVGSPELTRFLWAFGDGTPTTTERAPSHVYAHHGRYEVTLVGGANDVGMISPPHPLVVTVEPLPAGTPCDVDDQCRDGLTCVCAAGSGCSAAFVRGICSTSCREAACGPDGVCAALSIGLPSDAGAGGQARPLCIAPCQTRAQCAPGFVCQTVPVAPDTTTPSWTSGCLPLGTARDLGAPCRDADEALADEACATGLCVDVGALGICSAACDDSRPCPDAAACALLADGRRLCLLVCASDADCARDPLLSCAPAQPAGDAGAGVTVCAPTSCQSDAACGPSGRCGPNAVCVRK